MTMSLLSTRADPLAHIGRCLGPTEIVFTAPLSCLGKCPADVTVKTENTVPHHSIVFSSSTQNLSKRRRNARRIDTAGVAQLPGGRKVLGSFAHDPLALRDQRTTESSADRTERTDTP